MMTHDRPILFGYFLPPTAHNYDEHVKQVHLAEQLGLDLIGIQDHPYQSRHFDTWTLMSALASQTERVRFFPNVTNLPLRPPAMLAKAAASLDVMTRGRIELGLGAGFSWQGIAALGGPERQPGEAVEAVEEAIQVMRLMWTGEKGARFSGQHYSLKGAHPGPKPAHPIEIWLGAIGPRMLELTGRLCEGWIPSSPYVPPEKLAESNRRIDEAAHEAGRSPADIRRMYNLMGSITDGPSEDYLKGPVTYWVDEITRLAQEEKMDTFIFAPEDSSETQIRLFSEKVAPEVLGNLE